MAGASGHRGCHKWRRSVFPAPLYYLIFVVCCVYAVALCTPERSLLSAQTHKPVSYRLQCTLKTAMESVKETSSKKSLASGASSALDSTPRQAQSYTSATVPDAELAHLPPLPSTPIAEDTDATEGSSEDEPRPLPSDAVQHPLFMDCMPSEQPKHHR